jgi:hypothetical protein
MLTAQATGVQQFMPESYATMIIAQVGYSPAQRLVFWSLVLLVLLFVVGFLVLWLRRKLYWRSQDHSSGFSLDQLEAMRESGKLSEEEFKFLRRGTMGLDDDIIDQRCEKEGQSPLSPPPKQDDEDK